MKCLRCGYCCKNYWVIIIKDPEKGPVEGNFIAHEGGGIPCPHLRGPKPGEYWCRLHHLPWYKETPCYRHGQIEKSLDDECRLGRYILDKEGEEVN